MPHPVYYYYHDASGSTSHLADSTGHLVEWYRYDLQGTPSFYDQDNNQRNPNQTAYGVRHLFTGQQWYQELGLYDLRNRFYSPDLGRFLQPDPIGFWGDRSNLYRYCRNNPVRRRDPLGLDDLVKHVYGPQDYQDVWATYEGLSPEDYAEYVNSYEGPPPSSEDGPYVVVGGGPVEDNYGGSPAGVATVPDGTGRPSGGDLGGLGSLNTSGGWNGEPVGTDRRGSGDHSSGGGDPLNERLGSVYDYEWLRKALSRAGPTPADAAAMRSFANAVDIGAAVYVGGTLGPAAIWAGGMIVVQGPAVVYQAGSAAYANASYVTASVYVGVVVPTSSLTVTNPTVHQLLEEIIEEPWKWP